MIDMKDDVPAWVRFEVRPIEDRDATIKNGHYTTKDVTYALVTPPYSKDCNIIEAHEWLRQNDDHVRNGRMPERVRDAYKAKFEAWSKGQEIPEDGVPIKSWTMISPSQQANLLAIGVRTVESLAKINDEGMKRYGMGALDLKNKAQAWLKTAKNIGPVVQENAALKTKVADLTAIVEGLTKTVEELKRQTEREPA